MGTRALLVDTRRRAGQRLSIHSQAPVTVVVRAEDALEQLLRAPESYDVVALRLEEDSWDELIELAVLTRKLIPEISILGLCDEQPSGVLVDVFLRGIVDELVPGPWTATSLASSLAEAAVRTLHNREDTLSRSA